MSNAMSRSKSRWKGALLAGAAIAAASPLAAKAATQTAGTMSLSLSLSPMGNVVNYGAGGLSEETGGSPGSQEYIAPDEVAPIYVYATITQAGNVSTSATATSNIAGLEYAYFNIYQNLAGTNASTFDNVNYGGTGIPIVGINSSEGSIVSVALNPNLGFAGTNGTQPGVTNYTSGTLAVGSTVMTNMAKPRANVPVWSTQSTYSVNGSNPNGYSKGTGDGTNVFVSGNTISFLLETVYYKPTFTLNDVAGTQYGNGMNSLTISVPTLGTNYAGANYFTGETSIPSNASALNGSVGSTYTHTNYSAAGASVAGYNFSNTVYLYDAANGDGLLQGVINNNEYGPINNNYGLPDSGFTNGDYIQNPSTDPTVNNDDYGPVNNNYGESYGPAALGSGLQDGPFVATSTAQIGGVSAVPEPGSIGLLSLASLVMLRRNRKRV